MASPFTAYLAGMGTLAAVMALGFSTAVMLTEPSPSVHRRADTERPAERAPADPLLAVSPAAAASPVITAARTPMISTPFAVPPPLWPPSARSTTGQSSREPELAPDPGVRHIPVRPALTAEAAANAAPAARARDAVQSPDAAEVKKKKKSAQRKPRHQLAEEQGIAETRAARGYAPEPRSSLGIFGLFLGDNRAR